MALIQFEQAELNKKSRSSHFYTDKLSFVELQEQASQFRYLRGHLCGYNINPGICTKAIFPRPIVSSIVSEISRIDANHLWQAYT